jgi:hypothetical protein
VPELMKNLPDESTLIRQLPQSQLSAAGEAVQDRMKKRCGAARVAASSPMDESKLQFQTRFYRLLHNLLNLLAEITSRYLNNSLVIYAARCR